MSLKEEIKDFIDENGQVLPEPNTIGSAQTGNGLLYTSIYYLMLLKLRELDWNDVSEFEKIVNSCKATRRLFGLYHRAPEKTDEQIAWDDYIGVISAANCMGSIAIKEAVRLQCERVYFPFFRFCFPNLNPNKLSPFKAWFGRNPWFVSFAKISLNMTYTFLSEIILAIRLFMTAKKPSEVAVILDWCMIQSVDKRSILVDWAISYWEEKCCPVYPYFNKHFKGKGGSEHPITYYARQCGI